MGVFGPTVWRQRFLQVIRRGLINADLGFMLSEIILPLFISLCDRLLLPYFIARLVGLLYDSYATRTFLIRYCLPAHGLLLCSWRLLLVLINALCKLHDSVRDSRYLLGMELTNRGRLDAPSPDEAVPVVLVH